MIFLNIPTCIFCINNVLDLVDDIERQTWDTFVKTEVSLK
jgi:hypothetical protein